MGELLDDFLFFIAEIIGYVFSFVLNLISPLFNEFLSGVLELFFSALSGARGNLASMGRRFIDTIFYRFDLFSGSFSSDFIFYTIGVLMFPFIFKLFVILVKLIFTMVSQLVRG